MGLHDVLGNYRQFQDRAAPLVYEDFDRVAREADADEIGVGLADALKSEATPPAEQMVGHLYERSDPATRAGLLNEILGSIGTGTVAGGALGALLRRLGPRQGISPQDVRDIPARDVEAATAEAARRNPSVIETIGRYYSRHPQLVQTLGQAALSILMAGIARRRRI
jgi:hypothetical protein